MAFTKGIKGCMEKNPDIFDPKKYNSAGREEVKQYVMSKIKICGSADKAWDGNEMISEMITIVTMDTFTDKVYSVDYEIKYGTAMRLCMCYWNLHWIS